MNLMTKVFETGNNKKALRRHFLTNKPSYKNFLNRRQNQPTQGFKKLLPINL